MSGWPSGVRGIGLEAADALAPLAAVPDWAAAGVELTSTRDAVEMTIAALSTEATYAFFMANTFPRYLFASGSLPLGPMM
jgi:hypothetical protein